MASSSRTAHLAPAALRTPAATGPPRAAPLPGTARPWPPCAGRSPV